MNAFQEAVKCGELIGRPMALIDVTNIGAWLRKRQGVTTLDDIPTLRGPFETAWYECSYPNARASFGAFWMSLPEEILPEIKAAQERALGPTAFDPEEGCETLEVVRCYMSLDGKEGVTHIGGYYFQTGERGRLLRWDIDQHCACEIHASNEMTIDDFYHVTFPMLYAVGLLNCKNVDTVDVDVPEKVKRARLRRGKNPGVRHKVLRVRPMTSRPLSSSPTAETQGIMPLHLSRGHFKDYRDKGLFGRRHGVYWWAPHVRGKEINGEIEKTYKIQADGGAS